MKRALALAAMLTVAACTPAGPSGGDAPPEPAGPALAAGTLSRSEMDEARRLLDSARAAETAGRLDEAERLASRVVEEFPASTASVEALWLRARLRAEADPPAPGAGEDLERLLGVLPLEDPREGPAQLALARVQVAEGDTLAGLRNALSLPPGTRVSEQDMEWARDVVPALSLEAMESLLQRVGGPGQPLAPPALVAYARALRMAGATEDARRFADDALEAGATGVDAGVARAIVAGEAIPRADGAAPVRVGVVLPLGGSPAFQRYARELQQGMEAAVERWNLADQVELVILDDGGDVGTAGNLVRTVEDQGAVAVLGLLEDASLDAGVRARSGSLPLVSPTAYTTPDTDAPALSLNAFDPGAAEALADWAAGSGLRQVVVIHASRGVSADEARVFSRRFQELGGSVLRSFAYEPGATFFQEQVRGAAELVPEALVLPIPPEDVPALAPQVTFFGLDTLGIRILGTGGWTDPQVVGEVDTRHTDGVVVATPVRPAPDSEGYTAFRRAYEQRFQRSLVDGFVTALGYDAASLVLQGIYNGAGEPREVARALERVQDLPGATGFWSMEGGELRRAHRVVCLEDRVPHPLEVGLLPFQRYRPYPPDPETEQVPEGPGRPDGFICPTPENLDSIRGDTLSSPPSRPTPVSRRP